MQIMLFLLLLIIFLATIIYKINNKFQKKELFIFIGIILVSIFGTLYFLDEKENKVPELFKAKYEKEKAVKIEKLSFERLNNKTLSSNTNFIYNFDFIVLKDTQEFVCSMKDVKIKKIEDEYIFENFDNIKQECKKK